MYSQFITPSSEPGNLAPSTTHCQGSRVVTRADLTFNSPQSPLLVLWASPERCSFGLPTSVIISTLIVLPAESGPPVYMLNVVFTSCPLSPPFQFLWGIWMWGRFCEHLKPNTSNLWPLHLFLTSVRLGMVQTPRYPDSGSQGTLSSPMPSQLLHGPLPVTPPPKSITVSHQDYSHSHLLL